MIGDNALLEVFRKAAAMHEPAISFGGQQMLENPDESLKAVLRAVYADPMDIGPRQTITTLMGIHSSEQSSFIVDLILGFMHLRICS